MNWWPASTIKIFVGLYAAAKDPTYSNRKDLLKSMLRYSSNKAYDKLVLFYTRDKINRWLALNGYKDTFISIPYASRGPFPGSYRHPYCRSNCTSIYSLLRAIKKLSEGKLGTLIKRDSLYYKEGYVRGREYLLVSYCKGESSVVIKKANKSYNQMSRAAIRLLRNECRTKRESK